MPITIQIPAALCADCKGARQLSLSAPTVRAALVELERTHPALYRSVCDETDTVRRHVNLFVNTEFAPELLGGGPSRHMMVRIPGGIRVEFIAPGA